MSKHTPGPWVVGVPNKGPVSGTVPVHTKDYMESFRSGQLICSVYGTAAFSEANARLIAAAPENFDCNKELAAIVRELCKAYGHPLPEASLERSDAAIAKATGEKQ